MKSMFRSRPYPAAVHMRTSPPRSRFVLLFVVFLTLRLPSAASETNMTSALVILAEGAEEMEFVITVDILRRAGINVTVAGLTGPGEVKCSRDVVIKPDTSLQDVLSNEYDAVILPGGLKGSNSLGNSSDVKTILEKQEKRGAYIAAICAAPTALLKLGIAKGKKLTSYPSFKDEFSGAYQYIDERVVVDGKLITSRGPGTAFEFALAIVTALAGKEKSDSLVQPLLLKQ